MSKSSLIFSRSDVKMSVHQLKLECGLIKTKFWQSQVTVVVIKLRGEETEPQKKQMEL